MRWIFLAIIFFLFSFSFVFSADSMYCDVCDEVPYICFNACISGGMCWEAGLFYGPCLRSGGSGPGSGSGFSSAECSDGLDNDDDELVDSSDPGCTSYTDVSEYNPVPQCRNGLDDDNDGFVDYPNDLGCSSYNDLTEMNYYSPDFCSGIVESYSDPLRCSDGLDNDADGLTDSLDSGCKDANGVYQSNYNSELKKCYTPSPSCTTVNFDPARIYYSVYSVCSFDNVTCTSPVAVTQVCPSSTDSCKIPSCSGGTCSFINAANGLNCTPSSGVTSDCFNSSTRRVFSFSCSSGSCFSSSSTLSNCPSGQSCVFNTVTNTSLCIQTCLGVNAVGTSCTSSSNICEGYWCTTPGVRKVCPVNFKWDVQYNECRQAARCVPNACSGVDLVFGSSYYTNTGCVDVDFLTSCCSVNYGVPTTDYLPYSFVNASGASSS